MVILMTILVIDVSSHLIRRAQTINNEGLKLIEEFEGFSENFYLDPEVSSLFIPTIQHSY